MYHFCLKKDGLFLFDITTEYNSISNFYDLMDAEDFEDASYIRHSFFESKSKTQFNDFIFFKRSEQNPELFSKFYESHSQKIFSVDEIINIIPKQKFEIIGIWHHFSFKKYSNKSQRIHFLLKSLKND